MKKKKITKKKNKKNKVTNNTKKLVESIDIDDKNEINKEIGVNNKEIKDKELEEEKKYLEREFEEFLKDNSDYIEKEINDEIKESEEMKDIIEDFLDIQIIKDNDLLKNKKIDINLEKKNTLNNPTNPFIKDLNKLNKVETDDKNIEVSEGEKEKDISNEEKVVEKNEKINKIFIIEMNLIGDKNKDNFYYQNIKYANKKFNASYNQKEGLKHDSIYYYCKYHRTTKKSNLFTKNNNKKKISLCNAKIKYDKNEKEYYICVDHSNECLQMGKKFYDNIGEINKEINNYKQFREVLIEYLTQNPLIKYTEFRKLASAIYEKNNYNFNIENYTFSNIYYTWRKNSNLFNKYSIFSNKLTKEKNFYLRDYTFKLLYNKRGTQLFEHEHVIYLSNYFIRKLRQAEHFYIDGTFVHPNGFTQLIVIMYKDENKNIRFPGSFALINNKQEAGYIELFKSLYNIITLEKTKELKLKSYTTDFELGLINALKFIFPKVAPVGCFYHYTRALLENIKKYNLYTKSNKNISNLLLKDLYTLPYSFKYDINSIDTIFSKYPHQYIEFRNYFEKQWKPFFLDGTLDYTKIKKEYRSNSYIENYNKRIKLKLSEYLFGKSKTKISWPLFNYFIKEEENDYRTYNINLESSLEVKNIKNNTRNLEADKDKFPSTKVDDNFNNIINRKWLKYNSNSCRYDTFMFIYTFFIRYIVDANIKYINEDIKLFQTLANDIITLNKNQLNKGIWEIIDIYKKNYPFLLQNYKEYSNITHLFYRFNNNEIFCFKYQSLEGCNICTPPIKKENWLNSIIMYDLNYLSLYNIEQLIYYNLKNDMYTCPNCGYQNDIIINPNLQNYYKTIINVKVPHIIFIGFELANENDIGNEDTSEEKGKKILISEDKLNLICFNRMKANITIIKDKIVDKFSVYNYTFSLKAIISSPFSGHYSGFLINLEKEEILLKKGKNYLYDDLLNDNTIIEVLDFKSLLNDNIPYILIYSREI